jgi:hypothetical protein
VRLRAAVRDALAAHGIEVQPDEEPRALRERLNDVYLEEVRRLRERQRGGEIPLRDYAAHVEALERRFELLGLPLAAWTE